MSFRFENLPKPGTGLPVPVLILRGSTSAAKEGLIGAFSDTQQPQFFQLKYSQFKAYLQLSPGVNKITFKVLKGKFNENGYASYDPQVAPIDETQVEISCEPLDDSLFQTPKVHLACLVARDSPMLFDCPHDKLYEGNGIETAIRKLRVGGRLMQAFTLDEMIKNGFGPRCFQFVEETTNGTTSYQDELSHTQRSEIKIHVIRSKYSVQDIRNVEYAQQNPKAKESGKLFQMAMEGLREYGGPFSEQTTSNVPAIAAVMILDAHYDPKINLILGHAALGGGDDRIKLAIFGSQGMHSWPMNWESIYKSFTDCTKLDTRQVANDCNECGQYWECLCVSLGAFMHEIGHSLGCPHQQHGVMLRDYVTMDRKFLIQERACLRTKRGSWGPVLASDEPGWHRLDMMRFLYHPAFTIANDLNDDMFKPNFMMINRGMKLPSDKSNAIGVTPIDDHTLGIHSQVGIYLVEIYIGEWSRLHYEYQPRIQGGLGVQYNINLDLNLIQNQLDPQWRNKPIKLQILSMGFGQREIDNVQQFMIDRTRPEIINGVKVFKDDLYGMQPGRQSIAVTKSPITSIKVTHGLALDGVRFYHADGSYEDFGTFKSHNSTINLDQDEFITQVRFRSGAWVDAIQFTTNKKVSPWFGGNGGGVHEFILPRGRFVGLYGEIGNWVNKIGALYSA